MHDTHSRATHSVLYGLTRITKRRPTRGQLRALALVAIMVTSLPIMFTGGLFASDPVGTVAAEEDDVDYVEDFEDGDAEGWVSGVSEDRYDVVEESFYGTHSLEMLDNHDVSGQDSRMYWEGGPTFDAGDNFEVTGTVYSDQGDENYRTRLGFQNPDDEGTYPDDVIMLIFSGEHDETFLSTDYDADPDDEGRDSYDSAFDETWVDFRIQLDGGTARAKVWEAGTSEPSTWQLEEEFNQFEGQFFINPGWANDNRVMRLDRIDAGGHSVSGRVTDQNGDPVENATVETVGVDFSSFEDDIEDRRAEAEELLDAIDDVEPDLWDPDYDLQSHYSDADGTYVLAHAEEDWGVGTTTVVDSSVDAPRVQFDSDQPVELSLWDPSQDGGWIDNQVDQSFPGATTDGTIVVEQIGARDDVVERSTHETEANYETTGLNPLSTNEHHTVNLDLSSGFYRVYPEGAPERGYVFVVGNPHDLLQTFEQDLRNEAGELTERAQEISDSIDGGLFERRTTTTDENGEFDLRVQGGVERATVQAYRGDGETLTGITGPSFDDLRQAAEGGYNGSFYVGAPTRHDVPSEDVELTVHRTDELPFRNIEDYADLREWLEEERLDERLDDIRDEYDERLDELDRDRLEQVYESHRVMIEVVPGAEDEYLEESQFDEIQDAEDLTDEELETETELMLDTLTIGNLDDIRDLQPDIGDIPEDPIDVTDGELYAEYPLPPGVDGDTITPEIHWSDGTSEEIDDEYWSVDSGIFGSDTLIIDGFPIGEDDPGAFDIRVMGASDEGILDDRISGVNPDFGGDLVDLDAVDFSTLTPGDSERVYVGVDAPSGYERIQNIDVFGPDGSPIGGDIDTDRDRASFRTDGEGDYHIRMELESTSGHTFTVSEHVRAKDQSRSDPATIRIGKSALGTHAVVGEGLDTARVDGDINPTIEAVADAGNAPGELHIYPRDSLRGNVHTLDVHVLEGSDESQVRRNVQLYVHYDGGLGEHDISWVDGNPITHGGDTRWGEVNHRDNGKSVLVTYTDDDGTATVTVNRDAGIVERLQHWMQYGIPFVGSFFVVPLEAGSLAVETAVSGSTTPALLETVPSPALAA